MKLLYLQRGQSIVEFAIILPILVALLLGLFSVARVFHLQMVLNQVAREGSKLWASQRFGSADSLKFPQQFDATAQKMLADNGYDPQKLVIAPVTTYNQELNVAEWNLISGSAEDITKVKLTLSYSIEFITATVDLFKLDLGASYTFKKG